MTDIVHTEGERAFALAQREAKALCASDLVPKQFQGNMPNTLIAMDMANRLGASPLMVMQNLYIVHGRPAWSSQFLIATVNKSGKFSPLRYETRGDDPFDKGYRVRCIALDKETNEPCEGPWIGWRMVEAEGWSKKNGSKWQTMPDLMFRYRAAAFWTRLFAPEVSMGIYTVEEVADIGDAPQRGRSVQPATSSTLQQLVDESAQASQSAAIETEVVEAVDYSDKPLADLLALLAGIHDCDVDAVLEECLPAIGSNATRVEKLTADEAENARRWCLAELEVSNG